jgi:hypothetical protein
MKKKLFFRWISSLLVVFQFLLALLVGFPLSNLVNARASTFTTAFTTLTNSRFSTLAAVASTVTTGAKDVVISTSGQSDNNTGNIFPNDLLCFSNPSSNGCNNRQTYTVGETLNSSTLNVTSGITGGLVAGDRVVASQSSVLAISFTPTDVTGVAKLRVYVPAATSSSADGIPDAGKFDANTLGTNITTAGVLTISGGSATITNASATYTTTVIGTATYHNILVPVSTLAVGTQYTLTIGSTGTNRFINPSPSGTAHTRGVGDKMVITIQTEDSSANVIDKADTGITPNDGVFVSAYVPTSVTWTISAVAASTSKCGTTTSVATTADNTYGLDVPFGTIYNSNTFFDAAHTHTITTNAGGGYTLQVMEDGALKKDGNTPSIADGNCNGGCSTTTAAAWSTASNNGFGYTLAGTNATFTSATGYKVFDSTGFQTIASNTSTVSNDTVDVCYRLSVSGTQQAGSYYNKLTYQVYPKF